MIFFNDVKKKYKVKQLINNYFSVSYEFIQP